jgi:uncharacterized protein (TIGR02444 family)
MSRTQAADAAALNLEGAQWLFALGFYARPGVADALLQLQDRLGADVCLVLFALYAARELGTVLDAPELEHLDAAVAAWRAEVVLPLRAVRRRMRSGPEPAPSAASEPLRGQIKAAEICAEQIELAVLARCLPAHRRACKRAPVEARALLDALAAFYIARCGNSALRDAPEIRAAFATLAGTFSR